MERVSRVGCELSLGENLPRTALRFDCIASKYKEIAKSTSCIGTFLCRCFLTPGAIVKHYAIMDNDWYTAGFVPYLIALDGDIDVLALTSGKIFTS